MHLAFVLLGPGAPAVATALPSFEAVAARYAALAPDQQPLAGPVAPAPAASAPSLCLQAEDVAITLQLVGAPIPGGEADQAAQCSVSSFGTGWVLPQHAAHVLVVGTPVGQTPVGQTPVGQTPVGQARGPAWSEPALAAYRRFTLVAAAVSEASGAVGIYFGAGRATHAPEFFSEVVTSTALPLRVWSGVSIAPNGARLGLVSLGMKQFGLPELLVTTPRSTAHDALDLLYDLLALELGRGGPVPEGDTVGRTEGERLVVRHHESPIEDGARIWRVDLPGSVDARAGGAPRRGPPS